MGSNAEGKLGIGSGDTTHCNVPTLVEGIRGIQKVSCGGSHTLALNFEGDAFSWGQATYGALAVDTIHNCLQPIQITSLNGIRDVSAGARHSLFLTSSRRAFACGEASQGQLGLELKSTQDRICLPKQVKKFEGRCVD